MFNLIAKYLVGKVVVSCVIILRSLSSFNMGGNRKQKEDAPLASTIDEGLVDVIAQKVSELINKNLENILSKQDTKIIQCEEKIDALKEENIALNRRIDYMEQVLKNKSLRIFGLNEHDDEDIMSVVVELFTTNLKLSMNPNSIAKVYRINSSQQSIDNRGQEKVIKPRVVFIEFINSQERQLVLTRRHMLKGTNIYISEELTRTRVKIWKAARERYGKRQVWIKNGSIFAKNEEGAIIKISSLEW